MSQVVSPRTQHDRHHGLPARPEQAAGTTLVHAGRQPRRGRPRRTELPVLFAAPSWSWLRAGTVGWWVRPGWETELIGPDGLRLAQWNAEGRLSVVKTGPQRTVYRIELPQGAVYIKHFRVPGVREVVRQWVRRGKGRNEAKRAVALARHGVLTIEPIALGEERRRGFLFENYLISLEIANTATLDSLIGESELLAGGPAPARSRRELTVELARLTARLHNSGAVHQDFHAGNVLVRTPAQGRPELAMIDLDALRFLDQVSWKTASENLAMLNHGFWWRTTRTDRMRFLRAYLSERDTDQEAPSLARFAVEIDARTRAWAERLWCRWARRCRGTNKYFHVRKRPASWAVASRLLSPATVDSILDNPDAVFDRPGTRILKSSRTTQVAETLLEVNGTATPVIYKRFNRKKRLDPWLALVRPSRGWRAWQAGQHLLSRGVPTPINLLYLRQTGNPGQGGWARAIRFLPRDTYHVTLKAEPSVDLAHWIRHGLPEAGNPAGRVLIARYTRALARLLRLMHERSLSHRDLKAANILIVGDPLAPEPELTLIDLVGVELVHPMRPRQRVQNLARLHLSLLAVPGRTRTDALRFLKRYLPWPQASRSEWKTLWRAIEIAAGAKARQNERRGRELS